MNTVLIVFFIIVLSSFFTGVGLTIWENKSGKKVVCYSDKVSTKVITNNIVISDTIEVLEMEESISSDLYDMEII